MIASDPTFEALADATRRRILDLLREHSLAAGEIAGRFPRLSRPAVSKHLRVLRQSSLVRARRHGREQIYSLHAQPLRAVSEWVRAYERHWDRQLKSLQTFLETADSEEPHHGQR